MNSEQFFQDVPPPIPEIDNAVSGVQLDKNHLTEALLFLNELRQDDSISYSRSNIDERQANIQTAKDEELFQWMNESDASLWQTHPSFYHALIAELKVRKHISPSE